jgi:hypothetical protein
MGDDPAAKLVDEILARIAIDQADPGQSALPRAVYELYWKRLRDEFADEKPVFAYLAYAASQLLHSGLPRAGNQFLELARVGLQPAPHVADSLLKN